MKIVIPTNDRETIAVNIGRCREFAKYELREGEILSLEFLENHHLNSTGKCSKNNCGTCLHQETLQLFSGVDFIVYYAMGKKLREKLDEKGILYHKANAVNLEKIIRKLLFQD